MSVYLPPSLRRFTPTFSTFSTWTDHMPFGYDIVATVRPKITVELGTQGGLSFFTFCQSIKENEIDGVCYAVDTWEGEEHTGKYDESVYESVRKHAHEQYAGFAYLMRMLFNDALNHFDNESIDLLHIDGLHTYDAVQEDFNTWYPKVKPGGVILFHDVYARMMDFGAWKFWQEIAQQYPSFEFRHGFGLGVLQKPFTDKNSGSKNQQPLLKILFEGNEQDHSNLRALYVHAAKHFEFARKVAKQEKQRQKRLEAQVKKIT
jgi:hypothetical protein